MGIPLLAARGFAEHDQSHESVLLGESLPRALWPRPADGRGRWVRLGNGQHREVVGIVADVHQRGVADGPTPTMYFPTTWWLWPTMSLVVRADSDPAALAPTIRDAGASVPLSVLASVAVLVGVGLLATWLPARRVLRITPSAALRGD